MTNNQTGMDENYVKKLRERLSTPSDSDLFEEPPLYDERLQSMLRHYSVETPDLITYLEFYLKNLDSKCSEKINPPIAKNKTNTNLADALKSLYNYNLTPLPEHNPEPCDPQEPPHPQDLYTYEKNRGTETSEQTEKNNIPTPTDTPQWGAGGYNTLLITIVESYIRNQPYNPHSLPESPHNYFAHYEASTGELATLYGKVRRAYHSPTRTGEYPLIANYLLVSDKLEELREKSILLETATNNNTQLRTEIDTLLKDYESSRQN